MGTRININTGADFSDSADGYLLPVMDDLAYVNFFGSEAVFDRNLAENGLTPTVIGTPTYSGEFMTADGDNYINTRVPQPTGDYTLISVARTTVDGNIFLLGNYSLSGAAWIYFNGSAAGTDLVRIDFGTTGDNGGSNVIDTLAGPNVGTAGSAFFIAARYTAATRHKELDVPRLGSALSKTAPYTHVVSANRMLIGADVGETGAAGGHAFAAIYTRRLTDDELEQTYQQIQSAMAAVGVTV